MPVTLEYSTVVPMNMLTEAFKMCGPKLLVCPITQSKLVSLEELLRDIMAKKFAVELVISHIHIV